MNRTRLLLVSVVLALSVIAAECGTTVRTIEAPPVEDPANGVASAGPTQVVPTDTMVPFATDTLEPLASATATSTATPSPTPDLTQAARAQCLAELIAFTACVNAEVIPLIFTDGAPNHQIVNNGDPTTLYRSPDILDMLNAAGVTMVHNYYARPDTCPLGTACVLHVLMIEFASADDALTFFQRVTQIGGLENETEIPAPQADRWDASKCATGTRPSSADGAPPFAVIYCSVSLGELHWGFNLSAYENLPDSFVDGDLEVIMEAVHGYLSVWR